MITQLIPLLTLLLCLSSCRVHKNITLNQPPVCIPESYAYEEADEGIQVGQWWQEFGSEELNQVVECAFENNLDLRQAWWRIAQACANARIEGAAKYPEINLTTSATHFRSSGTGISPVGSGSGFSTSGVSTTTTGTTTGIDPFTQYLVRTSLSYEIDLWRRVDSRARAACLEAEATREDLESTALTLTGAVVDTWLTIQEQKTLLGVINHQIDVSKTFLELIELRFSVGQSTALDVYQQRLQLAQTLSERPGVVSALETAQNQLRVLMGMSPKREDTTVDGKLVELPPFPEIGIPSDLLINRPDLGAQFRRIRAADYNVAAAIAERFPRLDLTISYDFSATEIGDLFSNQFSRIIGSLMTPLFDGGRRRSEVARRKAILYELIDGYGQLFLDALKEVEDALAQEKNQLELLHLLQEQDKIAKANLEQSRWHYANGLSDYLTVIAAIQSLQNLERRMVAEKKNLLLIRSKLYRALGGSFPWYST